MQVHKRLPRETKDSTDQERTLCAWVAGQRTRHSSGLLPARHIQALQALDGILDLHPLSPRQQELKEWVALHGRRPHARSSDPVEAAFGVLVYSFRSYALRGRLKKGTLDLLMAVPDALSEDEKKLSLALLAAKLQERRRKAEVLAANIDPLEAKWNRGFADLSDWVREHGALPRRRGSGKELQVANWLNVQRMQARKGNLLPEFVARLQAVSGALEPRQPIGELGFANKIAAFHAEHGRLPGSRSSLASERTLGVHLGRLRRRIQDGTISKDALGVLSRVPGATELSVRKEPHERLADLEELIKANGRFPRADHRGLAQWADRALQGRASRDPKVAAELQQAVGKLRVSARQRKTA